MAEPRKLTTKQEKFVAAYIGRANGNATESARLAGYTGSENTLKSVGNENMTKPDILAEIEKMRDQVRKDGIAVQQNRIDEQNTRWKLLIEVRQARANDPFYADVSGGSTGLIVKQLKQVTYTYEKNPDDPKSQYRQVRNEVWEASLDATMLRAMNELEKASATELGQIIDKSSVELNATEEFLNALRAFGRGESDGADDAHT